MIEKESCIGRRKKWIRPELQKMKRVCHSQLDRPKDFKPFIVTKAQGAVLWDDAGKKYLDFSSQLFNVNAGHQHPKIIAAIKEQADKLCYIGPGPANETRESCAGCWPKSLRGSHQEFSFHGRCHS